MTGALTGHRARRVKPDRRAEGIRLKLTEQLPVCASEHLHLREPGKVGRHVLLSLMRN